MSEPAPSFWNYQLPNNGAEVIAAAITCTDVDDIINTFESAENTGTSEISVEESIADTKAAVDALNISDEAKAELRAELEAEDDWDEEPEDDSESDAFMPSLVATLLAESHMFFDAPYADISYEDRQAAVHTRFNDIARCVTETLAQPAQTLGEPFDISTDALIANDAFLFDSPVGYTLGEHVLLWPTPTGTWFLGAQQEDKELPVIIIFGHFNSDDHAKLGAHLKGFV
ncbi:MAG: hypothetical protein ACRBEQ_07615 [Hyphomonas sp.]